MKNRKKGTSSKLVIEYETNCHANRWVYNRLKSLPRSYKVSEDALCRFKGYTKPLELLDVVSATLVKAVPEFRLHKSRKEYSVLLADIRRKDYETTIERLKALRRSLKASVFTTIKWGGRKILTTQARVERFKKLITWRDPTKEEMDRIRDATKKDEERCDWIPMQDSEKLSRRAKELVGPLYSRSNVYPNHIIVAPMDKPVNCHIHHRSDYLNGRWRTVTRSKVYYKLTAAVRQTGPRQYQYRIFNDKPVTIDTVYPIVVENGLVRYDVPLLGLVVDHHVHPLDIVTRNELRRVCLDKLRIRRVADRLVSVKLGDTPRCTRVTREHSHRSGNCDRGTTHWIKENNINPLRKFVYLYEIAGFYGGGDTRFDRVMAVVINEHSNDQCPVLNRINESLRRG